MLTLKNSVAIVGRANVGKSMLFNRLCGKPAAIVHSRPGMTLDIISGTMTDSEVVLWDTAGIAGEDDDSGFAKLAQQQTAMPSKPPPPLCWLLMRATGCIPPIKNCCQRRREIPRLEKQREHRRRQTYPNSLSI